MGELNLKTTLERRTIKIDGEQYEIRNFGELKYKEVAWYQYAGKEIPRITGILQEEYDEVLADKFDKMLNRAAKGAFVDIPDDVYEALTDEQKIAVVEYFVEAVQEERQNQNEQSPGSSDSTEEPQTNGSKPSIG
jgi:hypothetical protein